MCGKDHLALVARECTDLGERWLSLKRLEEAESRDSGQVSLLSQVPTPITEMEISVKRVRAAAVAAKSSFL